MADPITFSIPSVISVTIDGPSIAPLSFFTTAIEGTTTAISITTPSSSTLQALSLFTFSSPFSSTSQPTTLPPSISLSTLSTSTTDSPFFSSPFFSNPTFTPPTGLSKSTQIGLGVGISLGALVLIALGGFLVYYILLRRRRQVDYPQSVNVDPHGIEVQEHSGQGTSYGIDAEPDVVGGK